jgi:glycosyltransferase involved in cell wall biosynthesis
MTGTLLVSANTGWNLVNFRSGILREAQARGWRVVAVIPPDHVATERLQALGCLVEPVSLDSVGLSPSRDLQTLLQFWRLMRKYRPKHYFSWTPKPNVYGALAARACGVHAALNISGLGSVFIADSLLTRFVKLLYRAAFSSSRTIFFQNWTDRDLFVEAGLARTDQAAVLPGSGINTDHFRPSGFKDGSDRLTFLMVARLLRDKGVQEFAEAAAALRAGGSSARFQLLGAVGVANPTAITPEELRTWVQTGAIEYLGEADDVRPHIAAADCVVLPSYREGTARVLLEASAMGKPVVASDVPGCRDPVEDGKTGILCAARSASALADALAQMATLSAEDRHAMGQAGRAKIEAEYDERIVIARYMEELTR